MKREPKFSVMAVVLVFASARLTQTILCYQEITVFDFHWAVPLNIFL